MKIMEHIERMREKPVHVRKQIALFTSLGLSLLILFIWIATLTFEPSSVVAENKINSPASSVSNTFTASASDAWDSVTGYVKSYFVHSNSAEYVAPLEATPGNR